MGDFRIVINAVGGHGQDRGKKTGEIVEFNEGGENCPEAIAKRFVDELRNKGVNVENAVIVHWPLDNYGGQIQNGRTSQIVDDLLSGKRTGSF